MLLHIKNMVCSRCKMVVKTELEKTGINYKTIELGEIELNETPLPSQLTELKSSLIQLGFEIIDDKKNRIIEKIKTTVINLVHHSKENLHTNFSDYLAKELHYDYTYLSNLFSEIEATTIEKYYITQRIEKVKELIVYNELTLSEIADRMGYSSVAYLSAQFKKITGLTPTFYRSLKEHKRKNIEEL